MAAHALDVNIFIWTSRKSVGHETNDRVMIHGDVTRADGRRYRFGAQIDKISRSCSDRAAQSNRVTLSYVVAVQPGWMDRPVTEAPKKQIYSTTHGSGAFPVPRVCTVVRRERASRSIVNRTTALWSIVLVTSLIFADLALGPIFTKTWGLRFVVSRGSNGASNYAHCCSGGLDGLYP